MVDPLHLNALHAYPSEMADVCDRRNVHRSPHAGNARVAMAR